MNALNFAQYFFIGVSALTAVAILFSRNVFNAAIWFLLCLLSVAALFILAHAEFTAVTQILIYAGGVLVVILFGIMFTSRLSSKPLRVESTNLLSGSISFILVIGLLGTLIIEHVSFQGSRQIAPQPVEAIGTMLMTDYALPFEVIGILLLITLVGAAVVTAFMKLKRQ